MDISKKNLRKARILAMQVIYSSEASPELLLESVFESTVAMPECELASNDAIKFAKNLVLAVRKSQENIDTILQKYMKNWKMDRLAAIDRAILRLAMAELIEIRTPLRVVIHEAVDIAKQFGTDDSGKFINGVLDAAKQDIDYEE
jgi:transcription antitermination protein NusB